jgi:hypothetical protein
MNHVKELSSKGATVETRRAENIFIFSDMSTTEQRVREIGGTEEW